MLILLTLCQEQVTDPPKLSFFICETGQETRVCARQAWSCRAALGSAKCPAAAADLTAPGMAETHPPLGAVSGVRMSPPS